MKNLDLSLYLVTDKSDDVEKFLKTIEEGIKGGVTVVQIREKTADTLDFFNLALKVKEITRKYNVPLIINDRVDVALAIDAEMLPLQLMLREFMSANLTCPVTLQESWSAQIRLSGFQQQQLMKQEKPKKMAQTTLGLERYFQPQLKTMHRK